MKLEGVGKSVEEILTQANWHRDDHGRHSNKATRMVCLAKAWTARSGAALQLQVLVRIPHDLPFDLRISSFRIAL